MLYEPSDQVWGQAGHHAPSSLVWCKPLAFYDGSVGPVQMFPLLSMDASQMLKSPTWCNDTQPSTWGPRTLEAHLAAERIMAAITRQLLHKPCINPVWGPGIL